MCRRSFLVPTLPPPTHPNLIMSVFFFVLFSFVVDFVHVRFPFAGYDGCGGVGWVVTDAVGWGGWGVVLGIGFLLPRCPKTHHVRFVLRCRLLSVLLMSVFLLRGMTDAVGWGGWVVDMSRGSFLVPTPPPPTHPNLIMSVLFFVVVCWRRFFPRVGVVFPVFLRVSYYLLLILRNESTPPAPQPNLGFVRFHCPRPPTPPTPRVRSVPYFFLFLRRS